MDEMTLLGEATVNGGSRFRMERVERLQISFGVFGQRPPHGQTCKSSTVTTMVVMTSSAELATANGGITNRTVPDSSAYLPRDGRQALLGSMWLRATLLSGQTPAVGRLSNSIGYLLLRLEFIEYSLQRNFVFVAVQSLDNFAVLENENRRDGRNSVLNGQ